MPLGPTELNEYEPCRDEKCDILGLHPAHDDGGQTDRKFLTKCPHCKSDLIRIRSKGPLKRAMCCKCPWRGSINKSKGG